MHKLLVTTVLTALSFNVSAALLTNGSFEDGLTGWECSGADRCWTNEYFVADHGIRYFSGYAHGGNATLSQTIDTIIGVEYDISFAYFSSSDANGQTLQLSVNDSISQVPMYFPGYDVGGWTTYNTTFTADSLTTDISFLFETAGGVWQIDNVRVVPIPAAVWLFGSALAGLGWMRRKQTV